MTWEATPKDLQKANATAHTNYSMEGPGVGADGQAFDLCDKISPIVPGQRVVEVGYGHGFLMQRAAEEGCYCTGIDIGPACSHGKGITALKENNLEAFDRVQLFCADSSHEAMPLPDDSQDHAFCTETIEHLSNPYFMCCEIKRVLKHGGTFTMAFPDCLDNLGYDGGQHAHVYPNWLTEANFELFAKQLYFKVMHKYQNGSTLWWVLKNYKRDGIVDVFRMTSGNYTEASLFDCLEEWDGT